MMKRGSRTPDEIRLVAGKINLLLMDCDGVLTDGRLYFSAAGEELKVFHVRDGQGLVDWHRAGFRSGIISGRGPREIIERRARELGIDFVLTESRNKLKDFSELIASTGSVPEEVAYIGDDVGDLDAMHAVGLPIAVADAVENVKTAAAYITNLPGGHGAVREVIDLILDSKRAETGSPPKQT